MNKTTSDKGIRLRLDFDSWHEFLEYATSQNSEIPETERWSRFTSKTSFYPGDKWYGNSQSFEETLKLANDGWKEGKAKAEKLFQPLSTKICNMIERLDMVYDVEGIGIDVGRYVDGEPECWQRFESHIVEGKSVKLITIMFNGTVSAGIDADVIIAKGAVVAALAEALEYAGNRVRIVQVHALSGVYESYVTIKSFDQPMDIGRVVFALAHPSMFRRLCFSVQETLDRTIRNLTGTSLRGGYGKPEDSTDRGDIYLPCSRYGEEPWKDTQFAEKWIIEKLVEQGITLNQ